MGRTILGAIAGIIVAMATIYALEFASHALYPPPPGLDPADPQNIAAILAASPFAALAMLVAGWAIGAFVGGYVAARIARARPRAAAIVPALVVIAGVVGMIFLVPQHPLWIAALGVLLPIPMALLAARLATPRAVL